MDIIVKKDYDEMSRSAAKIIAGLVRSKPGCVLGLATGSTPIGTYQELARMHKAGLDFSHVKSFNLDEYLGLGLEPDKPYDRDQSYARFMREEFFKHLNIKEENTHVPNGLAKEPENFCSWYEEEIKKAGGIDLQLLGIGGDGHWAFNEPGSSLASRTRVIALTEQTIEDNYNSFFKKAGFKKDAMPRRAITMGIGTILEAKQLLMLASGTGKADIVAKALEGSVTPQVTASAIQLYKGSAQVILDKPAAAKLNRC